MKHTDELTLQRLADDELTPERVQSARAHLIECARCQSAHESLKAETELIRSSLRGADEAIPDAIAPRADTSWVLIAVIVASVLGISAYWGQMSPATPTDAESTSLMTRLLIRGVLFRGWSTLVSSFFTLITVLVIVVASVASLRWAWKRLRSSPAALLAGVGLLSWTAPDLEAAVVAMDQTEYTLEGSARVDNDLLVVAERVDIAGEVAGDLIVLAESLVVSGTVSGDIIALADSIEVTGTGTVEGNLRTASRSLELEGRVLKNVLAASMRTRLAREASVSGSFTGASTQRIDIESSIGRDVTAAARSNNLDGAVGGGARWTGRELRIGPRAEVAGETRFRGQEEPEVASEAQLASPVDFERVQRDWKLDFRVPPVTRFVSLWAAAFLFGAPLLLLGPEVGVAVTTVHLPARGKSLLVGLLAIVTLSSVSLIALVTVIGLPLSLLLLAALAFGLYAGQTYVGAYIGREILGAPSTPGERLGQLALGLLLVHVAGSVPILGSLVASVVAVFGFGGLVSWAMDRMAPPSAPASAVPSSPPLP